MRPSYAASLKLLSPRPPTSNTSPTRALGACVRAIDPARVRGGSNVAKAGVINLAKELSTELAEAGVTVNCVLPGRIATPRVLRFFSEEEQRRRSGAIPMRRYGTPEEFAAAAVFLASERAGYITGAALAVDGGLVASMF